MMTAIALFVIAACLLVQAVVSVINTVFMMKESKKVNEVNFQNAINASPKELNTCGRAKEKIKLNEDKAYVNKYRDILEKISKITDEKIHSIMKDKKMKDDKYAEAFNQFVEKTSPKAFFPEGSEMGTEDNKAIFGVYLNDDTSFEKPLFTVDLDKPIVKANIEKSIEEAILTFKENG